jgi:hypothetical protein
VDGDVGVVTHRDRPARMNAEPLAVAARGRRPVVLEDGEVTDDLIGDLVEVLTSVCAAVRSAVGAQPCGEGPALWGVGVRPTGVAAEVEDGDMSHKKRKRSRRLQGRSASLRSVAGSGARIRLWPLAVQWYLSQERLALYGGVRVRRGLDAAALVCLPGVGEVKLETRQLPSVVTEPGAQLAAAVLSCDGAWDALIGVGQTPAGAVDQVLQAVEQAFVEEVGIQRARAISVAVLAEHPELADAQVARGAVRAMLIGGAST